MLSAFALAIRNLRTKARSEPSALYGKGVAGLQQQDFSVHLGSPNPLPPFMPAQVRGHLDKRNRQGTADEIAEQQFARRRAEAAIAVAEIEAARLARLPSLGYWRRTRLRSPTAVLLGGLTRRAVLGCPRRLLQPLPVRLTLPRSAPVCHSSRCRRPYQPSMLSSSLTQRPQDIYCRWDLGEARNAARVCDS